MSGGLAGFAPGQFGLVTRLFDKIGIGGAPRRIAKFFELDAGLPSQLNAADPLDVFAPPKVPQVPPPPAPPERDDPAVIQARRQQRLSELRRRGRRATLVSGVTTPAPLAQPQAGAERLGG